MPYPQKMTSASNGPDPLNEHASQSSPSLSSIVSLFGPSSCSDAGSVSFAPVVSSNFWSDPPATRSTASPAFANCSSMNFAARLIPLVPGPRPSRSSDAKYLTSLSSRDFTSGNASPLSGITLAATSPNTPTINATTRNISHLARQTAQIDFKRGGIVSGPSHHRTVWLVAVARLRSANVGWGQRRFVAPAHHDWPRCWDGGPALAASLSHPTLIKKLSLIALLDHDAR